MKLSLDEQEVHLSMSAGDPNFWYCYTDYPKWQRKMEKAGAELIKTSDDGLGKHYRLKKNQISIRTGNRKMSEERKVELANRLREARKIKDTMIEK